MTFSPTVERWALGRTLRQLREAAGQDSTKVARELDWDPSKVSRIEGARSPRLKSHDVERLLDAYHVTDEQERLQILAMASRARYQGWWTAKDYEFKGPLPDFEHGARIMRIFETLCVPGLFQTPDYARVMFKAGRVLDDNEVARRVEGRMRRQEILRRDEPPEVWAVLDESVLRKAVGSPEIMAEQLLQLAEIAQWPNISIQILPDSIGAHAGMGGPFTLLWMSEHIGAAVVYRETPVGEPRHTDDPDVTDRYRTKYGELVGQACSPEQSVEYLHAQADRFTRDVRTGN